MHTTRRGVIGCCLFAALCVAAGCAGAAHDKASARQAPARRTRVAPAVQQGAAAAIARTTGVPNGQAFATGLTVPRGFAINLFADGLTNPRRIVVAPGGSATHYDLFVAESKADRIRILRQKAGSGRADEKFVFVQHLQQPYGIAFHRSGYVYVGNTDSIERFVYKTGATAAAGTGQVVARLTSGGYNQHWTRNLLFSDDDARLYVTVGSSCNACEEDDPQRAAISVMDPDGKRRQVFATGMRNPVGLAWRPGSDELWTVVNERDRLGDDIPPDYLTRVTQGSFHGWPYAYTRLDGSVAPDPNYGADYATRVHATVPARVPLQAHSAALGLAFYPLHSRGAAAFPAGYSGDAFLAFHGSWNRTQKTGYKIVRVHFVAGRAVAISHFVTGFLRPDGHTMGRPVDVAVAPDGSLLFSDDGGGKIWRVSYRA